MARLFFLLVTILALAACSDYDMRFELNHAGMSGHLHVDDILVQGGECGYLFCGDCVGSDSSVVVGCFFTRIDGDTLFWEEGYVRVNREMFNALWRLYW